MPDSLLDPNPAVPICSTLSPRLAIYTPAACSARFPYVADQPVIAHNPTTLGTDPACA